jgi:hypothetical protein
MSRRRAGRRRVRLSVSKRRYREKYVELTSRVACNVVGWARKSRRRGNFQQNRMIRDREAEEGRRVRRGVCVVVMVSVVSAGWKGLGEGRGRMRENGNWLSW